VLSKPNPMCFCSLVSFEACEFPAPAWNYRKRRCTTLSVLHSRKLGGSEATASDKARTLSCQPLPHTGFLRFATYDEIAVLPAWLDPRPFAARADPWPASQPPCALSDSLVDRLRFDVAFRRYSLSLASRLSSSRTREILLSPLCCPLAVIYRQ